MLSRFRIGQKGFTLIEMAVVICASGLLMAAAVRWYQAYLNDRYANESYNSLRLIDSSLALFINSRGRLPCPSNPTIPVTDPQAGREIPISSCQTLRNPSTPVGTCMDGVCRADGRDTDADNDSPAVADPVLIGGVPFRDLKDAGSTQSASQADSVDPWGYQFTYAVSGYLTDQSLYRASFGAIDVRTEPTPAAPAGVPLVDPVSSSQYVLVAHGKNHRGAYTAQGGISFACGGTLDSENCDADGVFISGLRQEVAGLNYFDDQLLYNSYQLSMLWDFVGTTNDIYNRNPGFVGIGQTNPTQQLDVAGDIMASGKASMTYLCDQATGANCWSPDVLAAPSSTGLTINCPPSADPTKDNVMVGITLDASIPPKPVASCALRDKVAPASGSVCPAGQFVLGFNASGNAMCGVP